MSQTDEEVSEAMGPRETIGTAGAPLCAEHNVDEEVACGMLVQGSAEASERVRPVAATVQQSTHSHDNSQATHKQPLARTGTPREARAGGHHSMISGIREGGSWAWKQGRGALTGANHRDGAL